MKLKDEKWAADDFDLAPPLNLGTTDGGRVTRSAKRAKTA